LDDCTELKQNINDKKVKITTSLRSLKTNQESMDINVYATVCRGDEKDGMKQ